MKSKGGADLRERMDLSGAASVAEARRIRSLVNGFKRPRGVLTWNAEYGEDSTGDPAVWIWFHFKDEDGVSQRKIEELTDFVEAVRSKLLQANLGRWPYVRFRNPPEQR
jgi:hypothetical protein